MTTNYQLTVVKGVSTACLILKMNRKEAVYLLVQLNPGDRLHTLLDRQITHRPRRTAFTITVKGPLATKMFAEAMGGAVADCAAAAASVPTGTSAPRAA
jgi:hypothetical protein